MCPPFLLYNVVFVYLYSGLRLEGVSFGIIETSLKQLQHIYSISVKINFGRAKVAIFVL